VRVVVRVRKFLPRGMITYPTSRAVCPEETLDSIGYARLYDF
jgi:hypothetical protein